MRRYTIEVSEPIYQLLNQQAVDENRSVENILERLLVLAPLFSPETGRATKQESLAAVHRLTTLFADAQIENLMMCWTTPC